MDMIFLCDHASDIRRVYDERILSRLAIPTEVFSGADVREENRERFRDVRYVFSTWGMPALGEEAIREYFPSLEAVFYAAGTVGYFAAPFLRRGVRVFSAAYANGIPVAEYTVSQILLATKGYFQAEKFYHRDIALSRRRGNDVQGNYHATVGLIGLGVIGSMVAERLKAFDVSVMAYDPFATAERAASLGVTLVSLAELFERCDVVSNHLANKVELNDILNHDLFRRMKRNATFINTGRGAQVDEEGLARALGEESARTAVLDVQKDEVNPRSGPLWNCENAIMTPHIAGSTGYEVTRMADYMIDQYNHFVAGEKCDGEVTLERLRTMA